MAVSETIAVLVVMIPLKAMSGDNATGKRCAERKRREASIVALQ